MSRHHPAEYAIPRAFVIGQQHRIQLRASSNGGRKGGISMNTPRPIRCDRRSLQPQRVDRLVAHDDRPRTTARHGRRGSTSVAVTGTGLPAVSVEATMNRRIGSWHRDTRRNAFDADDVAVDQAGEVDRIGVEARPDSGVGRMAA